jgi:hypothetical protein
MLGVPEKLARSQQGLSSTELVGPVLKIVDLPSKEYYRWLRDKIEISTL